LRKRVFSREQTPCVSIELGFPGSERRFPLGQRAFTLFECPYSLVRVVR
jgi:hypothetical protein